MGKKKHTHTNPNNQVHSEYEHSVGNSYDAVRKETPAKNKQEADAYDPLNELPDDEYDVTTEWDTEEEPLKMSAEPKKVDKIPLLIGLFGVIGLIGVIGVVNSLRGNKLTR